MPCEDQIMMDMRHIEEHIATKGRVDGQELEVLRRLMYAGGKIDRPKADSLVELHKRVRYRTPGFEEFFYKAVKDHVLEDGRIDAEKAAWLRQMLFADHKIDDEERKFLHQLKGEARLVSPDTTARPVPEPRYRSPARSCGDAPRRSSFANGALAPKANAARSAGTTPSRLVAEWYTSSASIRVQRENSVDQTTIVIAMTANIAFSKE